MSALPAGQKKPRIQKPTGAPKRSLTSYIYFTMDYRPQILRENPGASVPEISKLLGAKWKSATPAMRKKYDDLAAKDKIRYEREKANYVPDPNAAVDKKKKRKRDPNAPKRPKTAYIFYVIHRLENKRPQGDMKDAMKQFGVEWKKLSEREKQPYKAQAEKDKQRYERELAKTAK